MRRKNTFVLATIGAMLCAATAMADEYRSAPNSGTAGVWSSEPDWEIKVGTNWVAITTEGVPNDDDDVLIQTGHTMTVDDDFAIDSLDLHGVVDFASGTANRTLTMEAPGGLTVQTGGLLEVTNDPNFLRFIKFNGGDASPNTIDGMLQLTGSNSRMLIETNNAKFEGDGAIDLANALVRISEGETMTIQGALTLMGHGEIEPASSSATFVNDGVVDVNESGQTLFLRPGLALSGSGMWQVDGSTLQFVEPALGLTGPFAAANGTFIFDASVRTTGDITSCSGSTFVLGAGVDFTFRFGAEGEHTFSGGEAGTTYDCNDIP